MFKEFHRGFGTKVPRFPGLRGVTVACPGLLLGESNADHVATEFTGAQVDRGPRLFATSCRFAAMMSAMRFDGRRRPAVWKASMIRCSLVRVIFPAFPRRPRCHPQTSGR